VALTVGINTSKCGPIYCSPDQPKSTNCWSYSIDKSLVREDELAGVDPRYSKNCSAPEAEAASNFIIVRNTSTVIFSQMFNCLHSTQLVKSFRKYAVILTYHML